MKIAIISKSAFPEGNASATYILNVSRVIKMCGNDVTVFGCYRGLQTSYPIEGSVEGITYHNFDAVGHSKISTYLYDNWFDRYAIKKLSKMKDLDAVLIYGGALSVAKAIRKYCLKKKILFGGIYCEWFDRSSYSASVSPKHVEDMIGLIPYVAQNSDISITISSLLTDYFVKNGVHSVMIPNIVDLTDEKWNVKRGVDEPNKLKIAYAGVPGVGKDELGTVVKAIGEMPEELKTKTELHVYGPDEKGLLSYLKTQGVQEIPSNVVCHGRQKQDEIPAKLNECHFTVLIRKPTRRANAGFSTKMVESFAAGIPFIANITGDIGTYLKDGENGIIVADESVEACRDALVRAWEMLEKNSDMRSSAYKTAVDNFDYRLYKDSMKMLWDTLA